MSGGSPPPAYSENPAYNNEKSAHIKVADSPFPPPPQFQPQPSAPVASSPSQPHAHVHATTGTFGPLPVEMDCPYCHKHIVSHTRTVAGTLPWLILAICFVLGFFLVIPWCLCCIPFCVDSCLDVMHSCPSCKRVVGRFSRFG